MHHNPWVSWRAEHTALYFQDRVQNTDFVIITLLAFCKPVCTKTRTSYLSTYGSFTLFDILRPYRIRIMCGYFFSQFTERSWFLFTGRNIYHLIINQYVTTLRILPWYIALTVSATLYSKSMSPLVGTCPNVYLKKVKHISYITPNAHISPFRTTFLSTYHSPLPVVWAIANSITISLTTKLQFIFETRYKLIQLC